MVLAATNRYMKMVVAQGLKKCIAPTIMKLPVFVHRVHQEQLKTVTLSVRQHGLPIRRLLVLSSGYLN